MKKIEFKQLASYLPYATKAKCTDDGRIINLTINNTRRFIIGQRKLILRPLSDLVRPVLKDGAIPIVEIGNMLGLNNLTPFEVDGVIEFGWNEQICDDYQGYSFGWCNGLKTFGIWYDCIEGNPIHTVGGLDQIEKLFEWHFDVYGLIEKGLAIDINTTI